MKLPWVSRDAFVAVCTALELERQRNDSLTNTITTMRQQGFTAAKAATVREPKDEETEGLHAAEQQMVKRRDDVAFVQRAAADMLRRVPGISPAKAMEEAVKMRREINDQDAPV